jgi:hypothetical protein
VTIAAHRLTLRRAAALTRTEWAVVVEALIWLPAAAAAARVLPLRRAARAIAAAPRTGSRMPIPPERLARLVGAAAVPLGCRCLPQALVTRRLLARRGVRSDLVVGTTLSGGVLYAHAWVEIAGRPVGAAETSPYTPLYVLADEPGPWSDAA